MDVKTFTDSSIQAALEKARHKLGDQVVLVESEPATENAPARIAVMIDEPAEQAAPATERSWGHVPKPSSEAAAPTAEAVADGTDEPRSTNSEQRSDEGTLDASTKASQFRSELEARSGSGGGSSGQGAGRGRVFPSAPSEKGDSPGTGDHEAWVESRLEKLRSRQGGSPKRGRRTESESRSWTAHPLFMSLVEDGIRPQTATALFEDVTERGVDPDDSPRDELHWALAQVMCRRIQTEDLRQDARALALVGPSGAGKTSLALKLAVHDRMFGAQETAVIHLLPEEGRSSYSYQNPTDLYRRFGLPVRSVRTEEDMAKALNCTDNFPQVVIDTPPLPMPLSEARPVLRRFQRLLRPLSTPAVHFVVDATRALGGFDEAGFSQLPLRPTAAAVTHLDETYSWGQVAEWLIHVDLPVEVVSDGPEVPDGARPFSLRWFVDDVMNL